MSAATGASGDRLAPPRARVLRIGDLQLKDPVLLAPMEGYSDLAFRQICRSLGASLAYTEFTNCHALATRGTAAMNKIAIAGADRPVGCQLYGNDPHRMARAAQIAEEQAPELIDLNFGCPAKKLSSGGCGSQLMRRPALLCAIVREVIAAVDTPVTCKLRLGFDEDSINVVEVCQELEALGVRAVTVHGRTRNQKYEGRADWDWIARVKQSLTIPVIGNGDVCSAADALRMFHHADVDAVMIGRAALTRPWIFREVRAALRGEPAPAPPSLDERFDLLLTHLRLTLASRGPRGVRLLRKMFPVYIGDLPDFERVRRELVREDDPLRLRRRLDRLREVFA